MGAMITTAAVLCNVGEDNNRAAFPCEAWDGMIPSGGGGGEASLWVTECTATAELPKYEASTEENSKMAIFVT